MKRRLCLLSGNLYALVAIITVLYAELIISNYVRSSSFLASKYILVCLGPLFTFCSVTFLSLLILSGKTDPRSNKRIFQLILVLLISLAWAYFGRLLERPTVLFSSISPWFALPAALYSMLITVIGKAGGED